MKRLLAVLALIATPVLAEVPEPAGFHGEPYNSPVPATLQGAEVIDAAEAVRLQGEGVPFLDAYPRQKRPDLPAGTVWHPKTHETIPGAVWLYDTGYDRLSDVETARLTQGLATASKGKRDAVMVIFCRADCWMSWNAGKRAVGLGYTGIKWFPGGTDDWKAAGHPLVKANPDSP